MAVQTLQLKQIASVATVWRVVGSPLQVPAWAVVTVLIVTGLFGYVSGRRNPIHHYVPYVGYPLVLDTTTGTACYSSQPKAADDYAAGWGAAAEDANANGTESNPPVGPSIPLCGKR